MKNFRGVRPKAGTRGSGEGWRVGDLFKVADQHSKRSLRALREAGTLQRFPRFNWRAGKPDASRDLPSGTESRLMNAARVYATAA